jgi:hypothetical protein
VSVTLREGEKIPGGRKPGSRIGTKPATAVRTRADIRNMTQEELIAAAKEALKLLQERFDRTGSLLG